jgi:IMP dehydrogenase
MLGSLFSGTNEAPGSIITLQGKKYKAYRGMGSFGAMQKGKATDRYSQKETEKHTPEGIEAFTEYRGPLHEIVIQLLGGIRSGMGYTGSKNIDHLHKQAQFIRITQAGRIESHPHSVILQDMPYSYKK